MARIVLLIMMVAGFALAFSTYSPGLLALGLLLGLIGLIGFVFALAAARVAMQSRPDTSMASVEDLAALRKRPASPAAATSRAPAQRSR